MKSLTFASKIVSTGMFLFALTLTSCAKQGLDSQTTDSSKNNLRGILNGSIATGTNSHPAVLKVMIGRSSGSNFICTGELIASNVVLTAAHCIQVYSTISVVSPLGASIPVIAVSTYPNYTGNGLGDIALLRLKTSISGVTPLQLSTYPAIPSLATIVGFGFDGQGSDGNGGLGVKRYGTANITEKYDVNLAQNNGYALFVQKEAYRIDKNSANQMTCPGDSGSPLLVGGRIAGILSSGPATSCQNVSFSYFTGTTALSTYINNTKTSLAALPSSTKLPNSSCTAAFYLSSSSGVEEWFSDPMGAVYTALSPTEMTATEADTYCRQFNSPVYGSVGPSTLGQVLVNSDGLGRPLDAVMAPGATKRKYRCKLSMNWVSPCMNRRY